ncbi:MAG TPA: hypothetical protein VK158_01910 [Acidobacteriota bacterium]|nr:hypothetical protein [Acidobacteriota bacterium]
MIRNKKAMDPMLMTMVVVIVVILCMVFVYFFGSRLYVATAGSEDVSLCQQQFAASGLANKVTLGVADLSIKCPVTEVVITKPMLERKSANEMVKYGITDNVAYNLDKFMWNEVNTCYAKVLYGVNPVFDRIGTQWGEIPTYCMICSVITVADDAQTVLASKPQSFTVSPEYMYKKTLLGGQTLPDHVKEVAYSDTYSDFSVQHAARSGEKTYAVIYERYNLQLAQRIDSYLLSTLPLDILQENNAGKDFADYIFGRNVQRVTIVPYSDPALIAQRCSVLANSFED